MTDKQYFCTVANDGVAVCVCKYRPCEKLKRKEQECEELKNEIAFGSNGKLSDEIRATVFKDLNDENSRYKQALDDIEEIASKKRYLDTTNIGTLVKQINAIGVDFNNILDIINKAKE